MGQAFEGQRVLRRGGGPGSDDSEDEEGIAAWGTSKKDLYNADQIETEAMRSKKRRKQSDFNRSTYKP